MELARLDTAGILRAWRNVPGVLLIAALFAFGGCASPPGAIAAPEHLAAEEGARVLCEGGNAIDAAVCVGFVLAVTHPEAGNLGGGGFLVVHTPERDFVVDAREVAPQTATADMYLGPDGKPIRGASLIGPLAAGVPGSVAGYLRLHELGGTLSRARLLAPAIRLAEDGFLIDDGLRASLKRAEALLGRFPESARFQRPGKRLRQPELAAVLRAIVAHGRAGFYEGRFPRRVEAASQKYGGRLTAKDFAEYKAKVREALRGRAFGHDIVTMPPPSSGGVVLLQMLRMLEFADFRARTSGDRWHYFAEAGRRAFADRARYFGDPDFVDVPVRALLDESYLRRRFKDIAVRSCSQSESIGGGLASTSADTEHEETCHFSVVDNRGFAVACTTTLNGAYGCGLAVDGVLLNNEMDDFTAKPGVPNLYGLIQSKKNAIAPGKRPLSSMTPTIVLKDGEVVLVTGSPGGPTIISTVAQVILRRLALGESLKSAVAAPRMHHQWQPDKILHDGLPDQLTRELRRRGHELKVRPRGLGDAQSIARENGRWIAVTDPRGRGRSKD